MASIETVRIEDVYPLTDEYGNSMARRDYSLKANKDYVKRLAESFNPETKLPDEPVVLVRDGGVYRIKTGNSRVEAMKLLKVKSFPAVVEDGDAGAVVEAAWRTDTKKTYEAEERAEIFKALTLFGDDEYVGRITGIDAERVKRIRKGSKRAGEAMEQMPMDWMEAVGEFEGDPEAAKAILDAGASGWRYEAERRRAAAARARWRAEMEAALADAGVEVADWNPDGMHYKKLLESPGDLAGIDIEPGAKAEFNKWNTCAWLYFPGGEKAADPEREQMLARRDEAGSQFEEADKSRSKWLAEHLEEIDPAAILKALPAGSEIEVYDYDVIEFCEAHGAEIPIGPAVTVAAFCEASAKPWDKLSDSPDPDGCRGFVALTDAMELCGYEPPEAEQKLYQLCADVIGKEDADE